MKVFVHLHSRLQIQTSDGPKRRLEVDLDADSTVQELIEILDLQIEPERLLLGINGEMAKLEDKLMDGDRVHLMLPISGGRELNNFRR